MASESPTAYTFPGQQTAQLEHLAGAAQQASSPPNDHSPAPSSQRPANPRKRRADGTPASARGVANLTPEQLARKRANDREAQRAIRERTKNNIETLEARIRELEGQQPFQEMQSALRTRDAVIAENEELKRRLENITVLAQYQAGNGGLDDLALATSRQAPLPLPQTPHQGQDQDVSTPSYPQTFTSTDTPSSTAEQQHIHPELRDVQSPPQVNNGPAPSSRQTRRNKSETQPHLRLPTHSAPANAIDTALLGLLTERRAALAAGESVAAVVGDPLPDFSTLVTARRVPDQHPLAAGVTQFVCEQLSTSELPNKVAIMYTTYVLLQWLIAPSRESYARLPSWLRPTQRQQETEHSIWIDLLPWPQLRDKALGDAQAYAFSFFYNFTSQLSLNFPYPHELCLQRIPPADGPEGADPAAHHHSNHHHHHHHHHHQQQQQQHKHAVVPTYILNPVFEAHLRDVRHWTMSGSGDGDLQGLLRELRVCGAGSSGTGVTG